MSRFRKYFTEQKFYGIFRKNFTIIFITLFIPIMSIFIASIFIINKWQLTNTVVQMNDNLVNFSSKMDILLQEQSNNSFLLCYDSNVSGFMKYVDSELTTQKINSLKSLQSRLQYLKYTNSLINNIVILYSNETDYLVTPQTTLLFQVNDELAVHTNQYKQFADLMPTAQKNTKIYYNDEKVIFFCKSSSGGTDIYAFIEINKYALNQWFDKESMKSATKILMLDEDGSLVAGNLPEKPDLGSWAFDDYITDKRAGFTTSNSVSYITIASASVSEGWNYLLMYPADRYTTTRTKTFMILIVVFLLILCFVFLASWNVSAKSYNPIRIIISLLKNPQLGTMDYYREHCQKYDEMRMILTLIENSYFQRLAISKKLDERNHMLQTAQNYVLAVQINPHFIFNTLENINWKIMNIIKDENEISSALSDFSRIVRYSLNKRGLVKISEEIECARIYARLRNNLSTDKFLVLWDVEDALLNYTVPFLIIQPLLENAITHGYKQQKIQGKLTVRCYGTDNAVVIEVQDNGSGFTPEKLQEIQTHFEEDAFIEQSPHIGLVNTHNRIRLTYGDQWGLRISSEPSKTTVAVHIPKICGTDMEQPPGREPNV